MRYIYHISDIHIRNGDERESRYKEYKEVIKRLISSIREKKEEEGLKEEEYIIVISGDVFHNKNVIGNYGLKLYKELIKGLTEIGRVILFHGNHDRSQEVKGQPSLLSGTLEIKNLKILERTSSFKIGEVGFSYVSVDDTLDVARTGGMNEELCEFPEIKEEVKYKIALYHGGLKNVRLYSGKEIEKGYELNKIKEYDYGLLGDIHMRQIGKKGKTLWGYSGSLIQQNYGEDIIDHGYLIWNLEKKEVIEVNVYNNYGFINLFLIQ